MCVRDIDKKDNLGGDPRVDNIRTFVTNEFVTGINAATIDAKWVVFQTTFSERATEYMSQWMEKRFFSLLCLLSYLILIFHTNTVHFVRDFYLLNVSHSLCLSACCSWSMLGNSLCFVCLVFVTVTSLARTLYLSYSTSGRSGVVPGGPKYLAQEKLATLRQKQIMRYSK